MDNPFENSGALDSEESSPLDPPPIAGKTPTEEERSSIITARGTADGLVLRIDGRIEGAGLTKALTSFVEARRSFLDGNDVALEWVGAKPAEDVVQNLSTILSQQFNITVRASRLRPQVTKNTIDSTGENEPKEKAPSGLSVVTPSSATPAIQTMKRRIGPSEKTVSLFDGIDEQAVSGTAGSSLLWDDPDTRIVYATLRSGQKIETEHSVVVFGDVNSGAEVIAGGDIVILGSLGGIAHAGAYDESGGGRVIFGLNLQPTQLRIGTVISRGGASDKGEAARTPEIARVDSNSIVVEPYQSRAVWGRKEGVLR